MNTNNFVVIQGWMRSELNLSGNDLLVYAIIYGFSQDGETAFNGSLQYLANWCGATKQGIQKNLKNLIDMGLIAKNDRIINGVKFCSYSCILCNIVAHPIQHSCIDNIDNNIDDNSIPINRNIGDDEDNSESHSYSPKELRDDFLGSVKKPEKQKRKSLYDKCVDEVYAYTKNLALQDALVRYLSVRLAIKEKPLYGVNQWIGLLNRLTKTRGNKLRIVEQSIEKGWCSFYEFKDTHSAFSEGDGVSCESSDDTAEDRQIKLEKQGRRSKF